ncbi:hypothetical protein H310_03373 [Aphanomyces invadans]|uniref:HTH CENPB-type domain-containing protein n=1 Tax=Aphanomyces invadans TaxID=157072 RepID=A0A024UJ46_9STRA|nr:hypothetical protein H310_03373 [Aphanomyces invadans]ETW05648.1 hypothetical protein H310_03373 [Aphanomyces invadans]|eukprot:XP_008865425.1 hypothetical protein H310_03373 [Aphanomyces invadans]
MIRIMALETAIDAGLDENEFSASWSWLKGFKKRYRLSIRARTRCGQDTQADGEAALATHLQCGQTGVNYEYLPTKTLNDRGASTIWIKCGGKSKERATAMVMADTTGKKYPMFLVLKTAASKVKKVVQENNAVRQGFGKTVWKHVEPL